MLGFLVFGDFDKGFAHFVFDGSGASGCSVDVDPVRFAADDGGLVSGSQELVFA